jgi:medium-chain acyl-[acyl-carrier-protein] hydrolase
MATAVSHTRLNPWLGGHKPNPDASLRLLCFPYAGGSSGIYREWQKGLPASIEVCAIQLPGRGSRVNETPFTNVHELVRAASDDLLAIVDRPFALFGHSMGALIAFEFAHSLRDQTGREAEHLLVSSRRAPHLPSDRMTYSLPPAEFLAELSQLKGTPREVLEHPELMEVFMPLLRADFQLIQTYDYVPRAPLDCPLTVIGASHDDEVTDEKLSAWRGYTTGEFSLRIVPGDHFFINTSRPQLLDLLARTLATAK